ncbi:MAG TPA: hypothetical protein DCF63_14425, partial [Planctomycetaceae bacterium]|nr:hypothetical protein [Planctomycetaceae bacterium]
MLQKIATVIFVIVRGNEPLIQFSALNWLGSGHSKTSRPQGLEIGPEESFCGQFCCTLPWRTRLAEMAHAWPARGISPVKLASGIAISAHQWVSLCATHRYH